MSKLLEGMVWLILATIVAATGGVAYLIYRLVERAVEVIDRVLGDTFYLTGSGIALFVFLLVTVGGAVAIVQWMARRVRYIHARDGMFPVREASGGHYWNPNEAGAQSLAVMAAAGKRPTAALADRVINAHYLPRGEAQPPTIIDQPPSAAITVRDVVESIDPRNSPHWLFIGATGCGKTYSSYSILDEMKRRANCQFIITEPGGVNWGAQAAATDTNEISDVILYVYQEMIRRQKLLRAEDVDHIEELSNRLPYIVLVTEEMDAVLDELKLTNLDRRKEVLVALRALARMGRKPGTCLFAVSQSGTTDVFDPHVRKNMGNVLLFRSEHTVNEMWRLQGVRLSEFPVGTAYSVQHSAVVHFPHRTRPLLNAPQTEGRDWVINGTASTTSAPVRDAGIPPTNGQTGGIAGAIPVFSTVQTSEYTQAQRAHILALHGRLGSLKAVQRELYDQDGGYWFYRIRDVVEGR